MKKFKNKSIKRSLAIMMICVLCIQFGNVNAFAQQKKSWTLIHSYSGTSGTNINSWSDTAKTTSSTVTIYVDIAAEGYPTIEASVTQGTKTTTKSYSGTGGADTVSVKKGRNTTFSVYYKTFGTGYSKITGTFEY